VAKKAATIPEPITQRLARAAKEAGVGLSEADLLKLATALGSSGGG
jgi:hypothetical protein